MWTEKGANMRYSVNYTGALFTDDKDGVNTFYTDRFEEAVALLRDIVVNYEIDKFAYLKDEEYQCSLYWDEKEKEFYWN
jgi:hypothetical protein